MFGTFKRSSLSEEISERLITLIREKKLKPGDKLPPERDLAVMMGVSRPSLREALRALALMNILEIKQGEGTYITSLQPGKLIESLDFVFTLNDTTYIEMFEARKGLEPYAASLAARRALPEDTIQLEQCLEKAVQNIGDIELFADLDRQLHEKILQIAGNSILTQFVMSLSRLSHVSRYRTVAIPGLPGQTIPELKRIVVAIKNHDPEEAYAGMIEHLERLEEALRFIVEENK